MLARAGGSEYFDSGAGAATSVEVRVCREMAARFMSRCGGSLVAYGLGDE